MELDSVVDGRNVGGRDRIARAVLAAVFAVAALRALRGGKRGRGLIAGVLAVGFALNAVTCFCTVNEALGIDTSGDNGD